MGFIMEQVAVERLKEPEPELMAWAAGPASCDIQYIGPFRCFPEYPLLPAPSRRRPTEWT